MSRALKAAQLALATLVLATGCDGGGGDESGGSTEATTTATNPTTTTTPTTGEEPTSSESGTSGDDTTGSVIDVDYMTDIQPIWDAKCVTGCHIESGIAQTDGPILTAASSYADLVGAPSPTVAGFVEVKAGDPDGSYLWHKVNGTQANVGGLGLQMPQGGMLSAEELGLIEAWISAGALP